MHFCSRSRGRSHFNIASAEANVGQLSKGPNSTVLSDEFNITLTPVTSIVPLFTSVLTVVCPRLRRSVGKLLRRGTRRGSGLYHLIIVFSACRKFEMTVTDCKLGSAEDQDGSNRNVCFFSAFEVPCHAAPMASCI